MSPQSRNDVNIIEDEEFNFANRTLKSMIAKSLKQPTSNDKQCGYQSISDGDLEKLTVFFDRSTPQILQMEVFQRVDTVQLESIKSFHNKGRKRK